ncbi:hypothetical protein JXM67_03115 [candidate division WOR-3 bacterium]|nr:hypothetical protein [candidate division WOR-3 bacterium]
MNKLLFAALIASMLGCFDYTSVMTLARDGSGTLKIQIKVPRKQNMEFAFLSEFDDNKCPEGWETVSKGIDTYILQHLEGKFSNLNAIPDFFSDQDEPVITVSGNNGISRFYLKKIVEPLDPKDRKMAKTLLAMVPGKKDLEKYHWTEIVIVEGDIIEHNSTARRGDTLIWRMNMKDLIGLMDKGFVMEASWNAK